MSCFSRFEHLKMTRTSEGVLEVRFTTNDGPIVFTGKDHHDFVEAFSQIAQDRENKIVILTGTGNEWFAGIAGPSLGDITNPREWNKSWWEGIVPADGIQTVWTRAIGEYRAKYFLYTQQKLSAKEAKELGVVAEILPDNGALMKRAYELAARLLAIPELTRRFMRTMFVQALRKDLLEQVGFGLSMEGISATDLKIAAEEKARGGE